MAIQLGVADPGLPGKVLEPNATFDGPATEGGANLEQFGEELTPPHTNAAPVSPQAEADTKRYEYWQSVAQKEASEKAQLQVQLAEKAKMDPLIDLIRSDEETFRYVQSRLTGARTPARPMEMPQRPDAYNEVEAYSNPESTSFKYRKQLETYKDSMLQSVIQQNQILYQKQEEMKAAEQQQRAHQEGLNRFKTDVLSKGIADQEFMEFFELVNKASVDDMVEFYKFKKGQSPVPDRTNRFQAPLGGGSPPGGERRANPNAMFGGEVVNLSKRM